MGVVAIVLLVSRVEIGLDEGFSTLKYDHFVHFFNLCISSYTDIKILNMVKLGREPDIQI